MCRTVGLNVNGIIRWQQRGLMCLLPTLNSRTVILTVILRPSARNPGHTRRRWTTGVVKICPAGWSWSGFRLLNWCLCWYLFWCLRLSLTEFTIMAQLTFQCSNRQRVLPQLLAEHFLIGVRFAHLCLQGLVLAEQIL